jgi:RNA polymerase sigma-70 factor (ECF subfamily)
MTTAGADTVTVARARAGDPEAFAALIEAHDRPLRALAFRLLGDRDCMDDVLQDAYVKAFRALPRFRGEATVATWLYRVVYNACLDELRRSRAERTRGPEVENLPTSESDPSELAGTRGALADALAALPPDWRAAVLLVDAQGFDYRAAAKVLGVRVGTLASRLSRARAALRHALTTETEGAEDDERP